MDITIWMSWFLSCLRARHRWGKRSLNAILEKARFRDRIKNVQLNNRQCTVINRLLDGKLTTSKYAALAKCSQDTAHRDIFALTEHSVLIRNPEGGRSTSYSLKRG